MNLPDWITVDPADNQLVGMPGMFPGATKDAANAAAQDALNAFAAAALASGNLACISPSNPCSDLFGALTWALNYTVEDLGGTASGVCSGVNFNLTSQVPDVANANGIIQFTGTTSYTGPALDCCCTGSWEGPDINFAGAYLLIRKNGVNVKPQQAFIATGALEPFTFPFTIPACLTPATITARIICDSHHGPVSTGATHMNFIGTFGLCP